MRLIPIFAITVLFAGCGPSPPQLAPVEGAVTLGGRPLANIEVVFVPEAGTHGRDIAAYTDADGRYRIPHDQAGGVGVPVGVHRVLLRDADMYLVPPGGVDAESGEPVPGAKNAKPTRKMSRVPLAYGDAAKTPLRDTEVPAGGRTFDIEVK
ncbi:hypothetical protein R5W24_004731 [Gemmata sp. JC717]|uniref:hypothetical protein n=1 Tax=Gemmata algarum TaxID=2975278 RepID=UPI0021BB4678|nr:hypothetical protein [Gemmata algarum]MDY3555588.1 hypothetical protein [Gemmata algarum]